jgi:peptidoglycan hydrolase-like protein with peptidoglycan-binding domain
MSRYRLFRRTTISTLMCTAALVVGLVLAPVVAPPGLVPTARAAVRTCTSTTPIAYRPTLRIGDTGSCVRVLQRLLIAKGYTVGVWGADGSFGNATYLGVRRFQADYYGVTIDGIVGPQTWRTLVNGGPRYARSTGPNRTSRVVLSFDDCPTSLAAFQSTILGAQRLGIALVLFPTGQCILSGKFSPSYARSHGHYVFNHTISHPNLTTLSYSSVLYQLGAPGVVTTFGRPPGGNYNTLTVLNAYAVKAMRVWTWSVDTRDWTGKTQSAVVSYAVTNSRVGSTVLMHMGWHAFNTGALAQIKAGLAARGLGICRNLGATTIAPLTLPC